MAKKQRSRGTGTLYKRSPKGPWIASWYNHKGDRLERSTRTTDRAAAERILSKHVADAALRREGVIDATRDRFAVEGRRPLADVVAEYMAHARHAGLAPKHLEEKDRHLTAVVAGCGTEMFGALDADGLVRHLEAMKTSGKAPRTINMARQTAVAFMNWCVKTGRAASNPLRVTPKQDESRGRRRVRRPLTDDEVARLLAVARDRGRDAWYLAAALAGLRKGDLRQLTWADVNFADNTLTIRHGKAKRVDVVPMHSQLADALLRRRAERPGVPTARVWSDTVTDATRLRDFLRAGIARLEPVLDADGKPVLVGKGRHRRTKTRIAVEDAEGRIVDLHALRTTLGTQLARAGVTPQVAQRIMRHSDYRTTLRHYTVLGLADTAKAVAQLPGVGPVGNGAIAATGTTGSAPSDHQQYPRQFSRQIAREPAREDTTRRNELGLDAEAGTRVSPRKNRAVRDSAQPGASERASGAEESRTPNFQLAKLALYQLSYRPDAPHSASPRGWSPPAQTLG